MVHLLDYLVNDLKLVVRRDKIYYYDMTPAEAGLFDGSD